MELVISGLAVADLAELEHQGGAPPLTQSLLAGGTHVEVHGAAPGAAGVEQILAAVRAAAAAAQVPLAELASPGTAAAVDTAEIERIGARGALCLVAGDGSGRRPPLALLYGRGVPALGRIPPCTPADLAATCVILAGGRSTGGRRLLEEQAEPWDPRLEQELTRRLRQLYGE
jgi:hypothetical protein